MANTETTTSEFVAQKATDIGVLALGRQTLIGLSGKPDARTALIMLASGKIVTGSIGDETKAGRIIGIDDQQVVLYRNGRTTTLALPAL